MEGVGGTSFLGQEIQGSDWQVWGIGHGDWGRGLTLVGHGEMGKPSVTGSSQFCLGLAMWMILQVFCACVVLARVEN